MKDLLFALMGMFLLVGYPAHATTLDWGVVCGEIWHDLPSELNPGDLALFVGVGTTLIYNMKTEKLRNAHRILSEVVKDVPNAPIDYDEDGDLIPFYLFEGTILSQDEMEATIRRECRESPTSGLFLFSALELADQGARVPSPDGHGQPIRPLV